MRLVARPLGPFIWGSSVSMQDLLNEGLQRSNAVLAPDMTLSIHLQQTPLGSDSSSSEYEVLSDNALQAALTQVRNQCSTAVFILRPRLKRLEVPNLDLTAEICIPRGAVEAAGTLVDHLQLDGAAASNKAASTAGAEATVDRGTVTYSRPVHDQLLQAVPSNNVQLGSGLVLGQAQHRQPCQKQQDEQQRRVQQTQQQSSLVLLQAEFDTAFAAADLSFQQAADSSNASKSCRLAADDLLRRLRGAIQNYKDGTSGTRVTASADTAQHAATAAATDRTAPLLAEKQREAARGAAAVLVPPTSPYTIRPPGASPRCGTAAPAVQTAPAGTAHATTVPVPTSTTELRAAGPSSAFRPSGLPPNGETAAPSAVQTPPASTAGAAAAAAATTQSPVVATLQQRLTSDASCPATAATPQRQQQHVSHPPDPAVAGSGAAASSSHSVQDSEVCLHNYGKQAAKRAATAVQQAAEQTRTSSQRSQQQQLAGKIQSYVLQLSSSETELQQAAAVSLRSLAHKNKQNSSCIVAAGAVQPLVALLASGSSGCQAAAADALLSLLCIGNTTRNAVLAADGMPELVTMLTSNSNNCQIAAAELLKQLARTDDGAAAVLGTAGSCDAAVILLHNTDQDVVAAGLQLLIKLLSSKGAIIRDPSVLDAAVLQAAAAAVARLLDSWGSRALEAAAIIADSHPHIKALQEAIPVVTALLGRNSSSTRGALVHRRAVVREAAKFLYNMAYDNRNLGIIDADGLKVLIRCIQSPNVLCEEGVQLALGAVYRLINEDPQRQQAAIAAGIVPTMVELLVSSDTVYGTDVSQDAMAILWALAEASSTVQTELQSRQAMSTVVELLGHWRERVCHNAAGLLMVLVKSSAAIKAEAVQAGAIKPLVRSLVRTEDPNVLEDVLDAVGSLAVGSAENQAAIAAEAGAVERLQELVSSDNSIVQRGAAAVLKLLER